MSSNAKTGRLTRHTPGSVRELWSIAWPLMLASFSSCLMTFADRTVLAHYQVESFLACTAAQPWYWTIEGVLLSLIAITEMFVGRYNGAQQFQKIGPLIWQMIVCGFICEIFLIPIALNTNYLLANSVRELGESYLKITLLFIPFELAGFGAIGSFFVGIGKTKIIPCVLIVTNLLNLFFDIVLVFGKLGLPAMGIRGAALGTGLAQVIGFIAFLIAFNQKKYHHPFQTNRFFWSWKNISQCIHTGLPNAVGYFCNMTGWAILFQVFAEKLSPVIFAAYGIANTMFSLLFFIMDGLGKSVGTVCSNFIGAQQNQFLNCVLKQSYKITYAFAVILFIILVITPKPFIHFIVNNDLYQNSTFLTQACYFLIWVWLSFILETKNFCAQNVLIALAKTRLVLAINVVCFWGISIIPSLILVGKYHASPVIYLQLICLDMFIRLLFFKFWKRKNERYFTKTNG